MKKQITLMFAFLFANPIFAYVIFGIILFAVVAGVLNSNCRRRAEKKDEKRADEIERGKGKIEILEERKKEANENTKNAQIETNKAEANFNAVSNTDSNRRDANFSAVKRKFCQRFPNDSKCADFR